MVTQNLSCEDKTALIKLRWSYLSQKNFLKSGWIDVHKIKITFHAFALVALNVTTSKIALDWIVL